MSNPMQRELDELFSQAINLEKEGDFKEALKIYEELASFGFKDAVKKINKLNKKTVIHIKKKASKIKNFFGFLLIGLFSFLVVTLLPIGLSFLSNLSTDVEGEDAKLFKNIIPSQQKIQNEDVLLNIIGNALINFKNERGYFPEQITDLVRKPPENWLSFLPNGITYVTNGTSFVLSMNDYIIKDSDVKTIKLVLFYKQNLLSVMLGEDSLYNFIVSSSSQSYSDYYSSYVKSRVSYPNGYGSIYGSRAFMLTDTNGIHGTNNPLSVGYPNTNGTIIMNDSDIEALFPYISIGTQLSVSPNSAPNSSYINSLPVISPIDYEFDSERNPSLIFGW